jgi:uncharacterized protein (TIGR02145 family)
MNMNLYRIFSLVLLSTILTCTTDDSNNPLDLGQGTVIDADNNTYTTVVIGSQVWTAENLRTTKYNDGTAIPHVTDSVAWANLSTPGYCFYNNSTSASEKVRWGALYNWYAVITGKLAPSGWRVPSDNDWTILQNYLIANGFNYDGSTSGNKIAKSLAAKTDWSSLNNVGVIGNDLSSNNSTGFSALPNGCRGIVNNYGFGDQSKRGDWWSATDYDASNAWGRALDYRECDLSRYNFQKKNGFSVRLVRDLN